MNTVAIIATFKNEATILSEWIQHYIAQGVDHFYLINDDSDDDFVSVLAPYSKMVTLFKPSIPCNRIENYNHVFEQIRKQVTWVIVCDITQYWYTPFGTIRDYLTNTKLDVITTPCRVFGGPGITHQPKSIRKAFTGVCGTSYEKTIAKADVVERIGISQHLLKSGAKAKLDTVNIAVNDYHLLSLEYFMNVRLKRSNPDNPNIVSNWGDFLLQEITTIDETLRDIYIERETAKINNE